MQFMIYEAKKEIKRLNTMHSIEMSPSWLFSHAKCKRHFFILIFCIDICSFVNNLLNNVNIFTWSQIKQHMFICQWPVDMLRISLNDFSIFTWSLIRQHLIILRLKWIEFIFNYKKWDTNWWKMYWKFYEYGVEKKTYK